MLVIDDEPAIQHLFRRVFASRNFMVETAGTAAEGISTLAREEPGAIMLDLVLPDGSGLDVFRQIRNSNSQTPVVVITASGDSDTAIEAMKLGAFDYLIKPLDVAELRRVVGRALEVYRLMKEPVEFAQEPSPPVRSGDTALIGRCLAMQKVYKAIGMVASQNVTVLIHGESGTGKELVARALYHHSDRCDKPFLVVNCAAIPEGLLESELFGHEKGSFTGADRKRIGKFEQCDGGTLFLDEIGDMSPVLQSKLLRVLQEQRFERVGGNETITTDVRLIAATNRNLEQMVAESKFRGDLYYRLNGYMISLPPLRERGEDLPLLVEYFRMQANEALRKSVLDVCPKAMEHLRSHDWPGNIRELQGVMRQAVLQTRGQVLLEDFLPNLSGSSRSELKTPTSLEATDSVAHSVRRLLEEGAEDIYDCVLEEVERKMLLLVLKHTDGNQQEAARIMGVTRTTLRTKLHKLGLKIDRIVESSDD
jgi:two-component system response regulator AtoC